MKNRLFGTLEIKVKNTDFVERCEIKGKFRDVFLNDVREAFVRINRATGEIYGLDFDFTYSYHGDLECDVCELVHSMLKEHVPCCDKSTVVRSCS
jgi:hypothetical protein